MLPNPKWSIIIGLISALFIGAIFIPIYLTSHNYCNEFCIDYLCKHDDCLQVDWMSIIKFILKFICIIFGIIFLPSYGFQILDTHIQKGSKK